MKNSDFFFLSVAIYAAPHISYNVALFLTIPAAILATYFLFKESKAT